MSLHPHRGWYQEATPRFSFILIGLSSIPTLFPYTTLFRSKCQRWKTVSVEPLESTRALTSEICLRSEFLVFVQTLCTPERQSLSGSHGQRPWFQSLMTKRRLVLEALSVLCPTGENLCVDAETIAD